MNQDEDMQEKPEPVITFENELVVETVATEDETIVTPTEESTSEVEPTAEPIVESAPTSSPAPSPVKPEPNTPGVIILQWLSYAFWGWLIVALIWLVSIVLTNFMVGNSSSNVTSGSIPYAIAAAVVLLPIAFVTDFFYRKHEPAKKTGVAMVILVIHAVLFALLTILALILTVFYGLNALIETSSNVSTQLIILFSAVIATALYAVTFLRVLDPFKSKKPVFIYSLVMTTATIALLAFAIAGPLVQALSTKDDRRIEQSLPAVSQAIGSYVQANGKLPATLKEVTFDNDDAQQLVTDNLVTYKAGESVPNKFNGKQIEERYQLCVTYFEKDATDYTTYGQTSNEYSAFVQTSGHDKGNVCYKLFETVSLSSTSTNGINLEGTVLN